MKEGFSGMDERARLKELYINGSAEAMSDYEILELFLFYAFSGRGVKPACDSLMARFGNDIQRIFAADTDELCRVEGVSSNAAALIHLVNDVGAVRRKSKNSKIRLLDSAEVTEQYILNCLSGLENERVIVITLKGNALISCNTVATGTVNLANVEPAKIVKCIIRDGADSIIVAHNHPRGRCFPSESDLEFTRSLASALEILGIKLREHYIAGADGVFSIIASEKYRSFSELRR